MDNDIVNDPHAALRVLCRIKHGLGDNCQFAIIIKHLRKYRPNWEITVHCPVGCEDIYRGLAHYVLPIQASWRHLVFDRVFYIHFAHPEGIYDGFPSTKVMRCFENEFADVDMPIDFDLFAYHCAVSDRQREAVGKICDELGPFYLIHSEGRSRPEDKNLEPVDVATLRTIVERHGLRAVELSWYKPCPFTPLWKLDEDERRYADAGTIKAIIERAEGFCGIDSGPEHVAGSTDTITDVVWTGHHPLYCYDLAPNVWHWIDYELRGEADDAAQRWMAENVPHQYYTTRRDAILEIGRRVALADWSTEELPEWGSILHPLARVPDWSLPCWNLPVPVETKAADDAWWEQEKAKLDATTEAWEKVYAKANEKAPDDFSSEA